MTDHIFPGVPVCEYCWSWVGVNARWTGKCPHCGANLDKEQVYQLVELFQQSRNQFNQIEQCQANLSEFDFEIIELSESASSYRNTLRAPARGLWSGVIDFDQFWDMYSQAIRSGLTQAWYAGAKAGGIKPDELSPDELAELQNLIFSQFGHIAKLGAFIEQNSRENGGKLANIFSRVELWVQAWQTAYNKALAMAQGDQKAKWVLGDAEHCKTCQALSGKVKRMSFWLAHVMPQNAPNPRLDCKGYRCKCALQPTDEPVSRGPLPRMPIFVSIVIYQQLTEYLEALDDNHN